MKKPRLMGSLDYVKKFQDGGPVANALEELSQEDILSLIREAALLHDIPEDIFARLIRKESGYDPNARSKKGAVGLAQLMPDTAKELGVNIDDPIMNIFGGADYLSQMYDKYGDWPTAVAAYNAGPGNVDEAGRSIPMDMPQTVEYVANILGGLPLPGEVFTPEPYAGGPEGNAPPPRRRFDLEGILAFKKDLAKGMSREEAVKRFLPRTLERYRKEALPEDRPPVQTDMPPWAKLAGGGPVRGSSLDVNIFGGF